MTTLPTNHSDGTGEVIAAAIINNIATQINANTTAIAAGSAPSGLAGGALAGSYPSPTLAAGSATGAALGSDVVKTSFSLVGDVTGTPAATSIASNAITTAKIAANAVTAAKLGAASATGAALGSDVAKLVAGKLSPVSQAQQVIASTDLTDTTSVLRFTSASNPRNMVFIPAGSTASQINTIASTATSSNPLTLSFEPSTYTGPLTLYSFVNYQFNWSTVTVANAANYSGVLITNNFDSLTGTTTNSGAYNFRISNVIIDGNAANQSSGNGIGLAIYGAGYVIDNLTAHHCYGPGIWDEYNSAGGFGTLDATVGGGTVGDRIAFWDGITLYDNGQKGLDGVSTGIKAPTANNYNSAQVTAQWCHFSIDTIASNFLAYQNGNVCTGQRGFLNGTSATGAAGVIQMDNFHIFLNHDVAMDISANPCLMAKGQIEGSNINLLLRSTGTAIVDSWSYLTFASGDGIRVDGGGQYFIEMLVSTIGNGGNCLHWASGGDYSEYHIRTLQSANTVNLTAGVQPTHATCIIRNDGGAHITGSSILTLGS